MSHVLSRALISSKQGTCEAWRGPKEIVLAISTGIPPTVIIDGRLHAGPFIDGNSYQARLTSLQSDQREGRYIKGRYIKG
jgi:hypothetical protein